MNKMPIDPIINALIDAELEKWEKVESKMKPEAFPRLFGLANCRTDAPIHGNCRTDAPMHTPLQSAVRQGTRHVLVPTHIHNSGMLCTLHRVTHTDSICIVHSSETGEFVDALPHRMFIQEYEAVK